MTVEPHPLPPDAARLADELFRPDDARLDEGLRFAALARLRAIVAEIAATVAPGSHDAFDRLRAAGLLNDAALVRELVDAAALDRLGAALTPAEAPEADRPSLLPRLAGAPATAEAATALLVAAGRSDAAPLPAEQHERLVWIVAASASTAPAEVAASAIRALAAHDEGRRIEAAASRLALAMDATPHAIAEAIGDRQIVLAAALLARALAFPFDAARALLIDPCGDELWVALRTLDCPRPTIATIAAALAAADPRRDLEAFAEALDPLLALDPATAADSIAGLRLPPVYHAARAALARV